MTISTKTKYWNTIDDAELINLLAAWTRILVRHSRADYNTCLIWCLQHSQGRFIDRQYDNDRLWYFENEKDAVLFAMQYGS
jgi:hypothetical protein